jgi:hypothetical protein
MKNTVKNLLSLTVILITTQTSVHAQIFGGTWGNDRDMLITNGDRSNHFGQLRLNTNSNAFTLTNYSDRLAINHTGGFTSWEDIGFEIMSVRDNGLNFDNSGRGIIWGSNFSKIKDDGNLNILTDDAFYIGKCDSNGNRTQTTIFADVNSGNVGIGTATPSEKLTVMGNVLATGSLTTNSGILNFLPQNKATNADYISRISATPNSAGFGYLDLKTGNNTSNLTTRLQLRDDACYFTGRLGVGASNPTSMLTVKGTVTAIDYAVVSAASMPDYVFANNYKLTTWSETEAYIKANKHLPAFKSAKEMEANGYNVIDMDKGLLQTIEEMTLHSIEQEKKANELEKQLKMVSKELAEIKALLLTKK